MKKERGTTGSKVMAVDGVKDTKPGVDAVVPTSNGSANGSPPPPNRAEPADVDPAETREWLDALESVLQTSGPDRARFLLTQLKNKANIGGVSVAFTANTPYINTIPVGQQTRFPGN